ncbi:hypothetical protein [Haliangium sp.]|uniref:hypothetical protein n=1 Tax=Haliangium sp. TaxID=2663208 RepID=UPI003D0DA436
MLLRLKSSFLSMMEIFLYLARPETSIDEGSLFIISPRSIPAESARETAIGAAEPRPAGWATEHARNTAEHTLGRTITPAMTAAAIPTPPDSPRPVSRARFSATWTSYYGMRYTSFMSRKLSP